MGFSADIWAFGKCEQSLGRSTDSHLIGTRSLPAGCIISESGKFVFTYFDFFKNNSGFLKAGCSSSDGEPFEAEQQKCVFKVNSLKAVRQKRKLMRQMVLHANFQSS